MRRIYGLTACAAALLSATACGSKATPAGTTANPLQGSQTTNAATAGPTPPASIDPAALVKRLSVPPAQIGDGWSVQTMTDGDEVAGQVTLDVCGAKFPSESLRLARLQTILVPPGEDATSADAVSNEVVVYRAGGAQQARTELLHAVATCPAGPVQGDLSGEGMVTFKISTLPADSSILPGSVALDIVMTSSEGQTVDTVGIYQFRGDALSAIYGVATNGQADADELQAASQAAVMLSTVIPAA